jgi:hypothetical protein
MKHEENKFHRRELQIICCISSMGITISLTKWINMFRNATKGLDLCDTERNLMMGSCEHSSDISGSIVLIRGMSWLSFQKMSVLHGVGLMNQTGIDVTCCSQVNSVCQDLLLLTYFLFLQTGDLSHIPTWWSCSHIQQAEWYSRNTRTAVWGQIFIVPLRAGS